MDLKLTQLHWLYADAKTTMNAMQTQIFNLINLHCVCIITTTVIRALFIERDMEWKDELIIEVLNVTNSQLHSFVRHDTVWFLLGTNGDICYTH